MLRSASRQDRGVDDPVIVGIAPLGVVSDRAVEPVDHLGCADRHRRCDRRSCGLVGQGAESRPPSETHVMHLLGDRMRSDQPPVVGCHCGEVLLEKRDPLSGQTYDFVRIRLAAEPRSWVLGKQLFDLLPIALGGIQIRVQLPPREDEQQLTVDALRIDQAREKDVRVRDDELHATPLLVVDRVGLAASRSDRGIGVEARLACPLHHRL